MTRHIAVRFLAAVLFLVIIPWAIVFGIWSVFTTGVFNGLALLAVIGAVILILRVVIRGDDRADGAHNERHGR